MNDNLLTNLPNVSTDKALEILSKTYINVINNKLPLNVIPSVMLWGAPGVGKSECVRQIAKNIEKETTKKVNVTDVRLLLFNPIDLRGIPTSNKDKTLAVWLKPKIFQMDESEDVINILFLDEISAAPQSVQAAAYQITLDRTVGEHKLPDNCIVIAAGNRVTDKSVAYKMPKALANRLLHFEIETTFDSWKKWAIKNNINSKVIGFLSFKRNKLMDFSSENDDLAFATPRSWQKVSEVLDCSGLEESELTLMIGGIVGMGIAMEFRMWLRVYNDLPDIEEIFKGKCNTIPKSTDSLYALSTSMVAYAKEHQNNMKQIVNSINYANKLPTEYSVLTLKDYLYIDEEFKKKLLKLPEYTKWLESKGKVLNVIN